MAGVFLVMVTPVYSSDTSPVQDSLIVFPDDDWASLPSENGMPTEYQKKFCNSHGKLAQAMWYRRKDGWTEARALRDLRSRVKGERYADADLTQMIKSIYRGDAAALDAEGTTQLFFAQCLIFEVQGIRAQ
jgi:hypothetical protein